MTIIQAIILGIVQGLTEFLPVSSSGHLVLLGKLFNIQGNFILFSVLMHIATLLAVSVYFYKDIMYLIKHPFGKDAVKLYVATIPTVLIVLLFKGFVEESFSGGLLPFCFTLTGVLLIISNLVCKKITKPLTNASAICIGIAQGIAVLPGISRSGATICTGIILGHDREESARFSFLLSIPIIIASLCYELLKVLKGSGLQSVGFLPSLIGFVFAFVVGILSIKLMMKLVKNLKLYWFSIYLFALAIFSFFVL